ncbi:MAG: putative redox protein [Acidobacteriaceae bacterium]|nr:putative redox protein [Acidobacteriaceae bacterium]
MHATVTWLHDQQYDAVSHTGNHVPMDADATHQGGPGPMEMVLMGLCSCTSVDVVSILRKKREPLTSLTVSAVAEQATEAPRVFTHIQLTYHIGGGVSHKAAEDAVALSKNKYCSVSKMLEKSATIDTVITYGEPA